jgi:hypothetical protein
MAKTHIVNSSGFSLSAVSDSDVDSFLISWLCLELDVGLRVIWYSTFIISKGKSYTSV